MQTQVRDEPSARARLLIDDWLSGNRSRATHGDVCVELRALLGVDLTNQEIDEIFCHAMDRDLGAETVLARLLGGDAADGTRSRQMAKPR